MDASNGVGMKLRSPAAISECDVSPDALVSYAHVRAGGFLLPNQYDEVPRVT